MSVRHSDFGRLNSCVKKHAGRYFYIGKQNCHRSVVVVRIGTPLAFIFYEYGSIRIIPKLLTK